MIKTSFAVVFCLILAVIYSSSDNNKNSKDPTSGRNMIHQQDDGSYFLKMEDAACYVEQTDPTENTAEYNIQVISEKVTKTNMTSQNNTAEDNTKLVS
jgi:hypothetical protein